MHFIDASLQYLTIGPVSPKFLNSRLGLNTKIEEAKFRIVRFKFFYRSFPQRLQLSSAVNSKEESSFTPEALILTSDSCSKSDGLYKQVNFLHPLL